MADRAAVIKAIREHYAKLGIPLDELSDNDVEMGVRQLADAARESGTGSEEATAAMRVAVETAKAQRAARQAEAAATAEADDDPGDDGPASPDGET